MKNIGQNIKKQRLRKKLSQTELANKTNLTQNTIYRIERNLHVPTTQTLYKIAKVLNVTIDELFHPKELTK